MPYFITDFITEFYNRKNDFAEGSQILLDTNQKIILLEP